MNTKLKTLLIFSSGLLLLSSVGLMVCVILISKNKGHAYETNKELLEEQYRTDQAKKASSVLEQSKDPITFLKNYLVPDDEIVGVVESIEKLADNTSVKATISGLSADDSSNLPGGTINKIKARLDGKGSWRGVQTFLALLEAMPHKILLSNISLRRVEGLENGTPVWNFSLQIEILKIK